MIKGTEIMIDPGTDGSEADPALIEAWLTARSIVRGLPLPLTDSGGLRVDTGSAAEQRRYVFACPGEGLRHLADSIDTAFVALKLCAPSARLMAMVPPRWQLMAPGFVMTAPGPAAAREPDLPGGYRLDVVRDGAIIRARLLTTADELAASGSAVTARGVFIYDQIVTDAGHRRRGLARLIMHTLAAARAAGTPQVLVATVDGRALYERLGWSVHAPYSSVMIPVGAAALSGPS